MVGVTGWRGSQLPKLICLGVLLAALVCGECAPRAHGDWVPAGDAAFVGWLKLKQPSWRQWLSEGMPLKVLLGLPVIPPPISTQNDLRPPPGHTQHRDVLFKSPWTECNKIPHLAFEVVFLRF